MGGGVGQRPSHRRRNSLRTISEGRAISGCPAKSAETAHTTSHTPSFTATDYFHLITLPLQQPLLQEQN